MEVFIATEALGAVGLILSGTSVCLSGMASAACASVVSCGWLLDTGVPGQLGSGDGTSALPRETCWPPLLHETGFKPLLWPGAALGTAVHREPREAGPALQSLPSNALVLSPAHRIIWELF